MLRKITTIDAFDQLLESKEVFYFLKHSNSCPVSQAAYETFEKFHYECDMDGYYLIVQDHAELSKHIEEKYGIKHESPQAFYFKNKAVKWNGSHQEIQMNTLSNAED
ncbi:bacillithiol system redox-active protein YtxJ [Aliicoccus persicus]|uniref:Bacillithiol system protein YtxJ n=1 Tax=Aliicoccus persicus TaxID=930138 RepID=A0A662Z6M3_9STAP|nr:bacillithiol system redox-active protein YtxJ [Aliicoccus persicus]SEW00317.1 bacillithiol system protein YtxJ [Aliicoccus persicus]